MTDIVGTSFQDVSTAQSTLRKLYPTSRLAGAEKKLAAGLNGDVYAKKRATIGIRDSKIMVRVAVVSGVTILRSLEYMLDSVKLAGRGGLVSSSTGLIDQNGTRISRVNIQSAITRTVDGINNVVASLGSPFANLLSSQSFDLSFRTTKYGGTVRIAPQPLDAVGLNIQNLNIMNQNSLLDATNRISKAIETAQSRVFRLQNLETGLNNPDALASALSKFGTNNTGTLGTFVNLSA